MRVFRFSNPVHWQAWRALAILFAGVLVLAGAGWWILVGYQERRLDDMRADLAQQGVELSLEKLRRNPIPDSENAAIVYREAAALLATSSGTEDERRVLERIFYASELEEAQYLENPSDGRTINPTDMSNVRSLCRFLVNEAQRISDEDPDRAWKCIESGLHLSNTLTDDPLLIFLMVRVASASLILDGASSLISSTPISEQRADSIRRELAVLRDRRKVQRTIEWEMASFTDAASDMGKEASLWGFVFRPLNLLTEIELLKMFGGIRDLTLEPHYLAKSKYDELTSLGYPMAVFLPNVGRSFQSVDEMVAQCDLLDIAIALETYHANENIYPETLGALSPGYISDKIADPFSGDPYLYHIADKGFTLYGVGANGVDDGGGGDDVVWNSSESGLASEL